MTTAELRSTFVLDALFVPGALTMTYCDVDRAILGGAIPTTRPLELQSSKKEMSSDYFAERREIGIVNIGGRGSVVADGQEFVAGVHDMVYVGRGTKEVRFKSDDPSNPAVFYFASFPAHAAYPNTPVPKSTADHAELGLRCRCQQADDQPVHSSRRGQELPAGDGNDRIGTRKRMEHHAPAHSSTAHGSVSLL